MKTCIFDLDGTLLNTLDDLTDSLNHALDQFNMANRTLAEVRSFVGNGIRVFIERSVPSDTEDAVIEQVYQCFMQHYEHNKDNKTGPYEGILDLLETLSLSGVPMAILSNKEDAALRQLADKFFPGIFKFVQGEQPHLAKKPSPDGLNMLLKHFDIDASDAYYIGDSEVDVATAIAGNVPMIGCLWGFRDKEVLVKAGATCFIQQPQELLPVLFESE